MVLGSEEKRILLLIPDSYHYIRTIIRGICQQVWPIKSWVLARGDIRSDSLKAIHQWRPSGVIAHVSTEEIDHRLRELHVPVVNTSGVLTDLPYPSVGIDNSAVGRMAARHFIERGFRHCAILENPFPAYAKVRAQAFRHELQLAGVTDVSNIVRQYQFPDAWSAGAGDPRLLQLHDLPKPIGIFTSNDIEAAGLSMWCRQANIRVPEEVAILGCDNDELYCQLCSPPLSSIAMPGERVGREAVALLERLLAGIPAPREPILFRPINLITRQSTDTYPVNDPEVAQALRYIADHAGESITVDDLLAVVPVSRRTLEMHFRQAIGHTPGEEIRRMQLEQAKRLLEDTDMSMAEIAAACGFTTQQHFAFFFRRAIGYTPSAYRRMQRAREI